MNKRILSGLMGFAMLLTGCVGGLQTNKVPVNIGFKPVIGNDTRAQESVPFPEDRSFTLWARNTQSGGLHIEKADVSYDNGWTAPKPWGEEPLAFSACWPTDLDLIYSHSNGLQLEDFDCSEGDLDILVAEVTAENEAGAPVTLNFEHILSRVEFRVNHSLTESTAIKLNRVELKGFADKADYNTDLKGEWTSHTGEGSFVAYDDPEGMIISSDTQNYIGGEFHVVPQLAYGHLEVKCQVKYGVGNWVPQTYVIDDMELVWDPGKHYTYSLTIRMDRMSYTTGISAMVNR